MQAPRTSGVLVRAASAADLMLWPSERSVPSYQRAGFHQADVLELEL